MKEYTKLTNDIINNYKLSETQIEKIIEYLFPVNENIKVSSSHPFIVSDKLINEQAVNLTLNYNDKIGEAATLYKNQFNQGNNLLIKSSDIRNDLIGYILISINNTKIQFLLSLIIKKITKENVIFGLSDLDNFLKNSVVFEPQNQYKKGSVFPCALELDDKNTLSLYNRIKEIDNSIISTSDSKNKFFLVIEENVGIRMSLKSKNDSLEPIIAYTDNGDFYYKFVEGGIILDESKIRLFVVNYDN